MSQHRILSGMVVRSRDGEPLGRVIAVDDEGFVLERKVVVTREHRVRFEEIHTQDEHGVVLEQEHARPRQSLEATDLVEVFWSAKRARDEQQPLEAREDPETLASHKMVAATEHAEAYPVQVERGTVRSPRYVPMSEESFRESGRVREEASPLPRAAPVDPPQKRRTHIPWSHAAAHPLRTATSLLGRLLGEKSNSRH